MLNALSVSLALFLSCCCVCARILLMCFVDDIAFRLQYRYITRYFSFFQLCVCVYVYCVVRPNSENLTQSVCSHEIRVCVLLSVYSHESSLIIIVVYVGRIAATSGKTFVLIRTIRMAKCIQRGEWTRDKGLYYIHYFFSTSTHCIQWRVVQLIWLYEYKLKYLKTNLKMGFPLVKRFLLPL